MTVGGVLIAATAFVTSCVAVPLVRDTARRRGLLDPQGPLKIHAHPTPRLGGIAIFFGMIIAIGVGTAVGSAECLALLAALTVVCATGLIDDLRGLSARWRLTAQTLAAAMLWSGGWSVRLGSGPLDFVATCFVVLLFVNAFNLLDGADGVAAGVAMIVCIGHLGVGAMRTPDVTQVVAWALLGACAAFLCFNFPTASIFMGDAGSTTVGLVLAALALSYTREGDPSRFAVPLLFSALPLTDVGLAVVRRTRRGVSPFCGDRQHFYDLLRQRGLTSRAVALSCYSITAAFVAGGWVAHQRGSGHARWLLVALSGAFALLAAGLGALDVEPVRDRPAPSGTRTTVL